VSRKIERNDNLAFSIGEKIDLKESGKCLKEKRLEMILRENSRHDDW
jgi:hypothetical protein